MPNTIAPVPFPYANLSHKEWLATDKAIRGAVDLLKSKKCGCIEVKVPYRVDTMVKVLGVVQFVYSAATDGVVVASENSVRDSLWPWIDVAEEAGAVVGGYAEAIAENGHLQREQKCLTIDALGRDPLNAPIPPGVW